MLDKLTEELQCKESASEARSMEEVYEIIKNFRSPPMTDEMLPVRGVFCQ